MILYFMCSMYPPSPGRAVQYISVTLCTISYALLHCIVQLVFHHCSELARAIFPIKWKI